MDESVRRAHELGYTDSFGKLIADSTANVADISSNYPYSPERWRVYYDSGSTGTYNRRLIQYGDDANFSDSVDTHDLAPSVGDTMMMETAESYRYVVQYVLRPSFAFEVNQTLQEGDKVTVAFGDADLNNNMTNADGWILEFDGDEQSDIGYWSMYRDGTVVSNGGERKEVQFNNKITNWRRMAMDVNWYNVGKAELIETYTDGGKQFNPRVKSISADDERGPESAIHPIQFSIRSNSSGLELNAGSVAMIVLGDTQSIFRTKSFTREEAVSTTGEWEPLLAMRVDPNRDKIATFLESINALNYSASDTVRIHAQAFDPSKVTFAGTDSWATPPELSETNTALEIREDIDQIANNNGTLSTTVTNPGGFQVGAVALTVSNLQGNSFNIQPAQQKTKRPMYGDDVIVVMAKAGSTGDAIFDVNLRQDW